MKTFWSPILNFFIRFFCAKTKFIHRISEKNRKNPETTKKSRIPGISQKSRKNPDSQKIVKTQNFFIYFLKVFQISVQKRPNFGYRKVRSIINRCLFKCDKSEIPGIPIPGIMGFSGFFTRDFFGIFISRFRSPGFRDFSI